MGKKSEIDSLMLEYRKLKHISSQVVNDTLIHNTDFHCWLANIVIDTINYENILLDILNSECKGLNIKKIAEIYSRPILSVSEKITNNFIPAINYNDYVNELGEVNDFQASKSELIKNIDSIDLLLGQSNQYEDLKKQRDKLTVIRSFAQKEDKPFIIGCYGYSDSEELQKRIDVLDEFKSRLDCDVNVYSETCNGIDCKVLIKL